MRKFRVILVETSPCMPIYLVTFCFEPLKRLYRSIESESYLDSTVRIVWHDVLKLNCTRSSKATLPLLFSPVARNFSNCKVWQNWMLSQLQECHRKSQRSPPNMIDVSRDWLACSEVLEQATHLMV